MKSSVRLAFEQFARRNIDAKELSAATGMVWKFKDSGGGFEIVRPVEVLPPVEVGAEDIARALEDHQKGDFSASDLQEWANLVILCDSYELSPSDPDILASVLHKLGSPEIFGGLTTEMTNSLRTDLKRIARR